MDDHEPQHEHSGRMRVDPVTGRRLAVVVYGSAESTDEPPEPPCDDEPKPKRRPAWRHALGGLVLLACIGFSVWRLEERGWTDWGGNWRRFQIEVWGHESIREQVKVGMTRDEVRARIGRGQDVCLRYTVAAERYHERGFQVVFFKEKCGDDWDWYVHSVEDWPAAGSWRRPDEP